MGNIQTYQLQIIDSGGGGVVNYQTQIVTTKLPNENIQTYQLQMINSGEGDGVNYQIQIVTSFLSLTCVIVFVVDGITIGSLPPPPESIICSW